MEGPAGFEVFDLAEVDLPPQVPGVRLTSTGVLLLNRRAWELLAESGAGSRVLLLFHPEKREAGLQMAWSAGTPTSVFDLEPNRSPDWPRRLRAAEFVAHHRVCEGIFRASLEMTSRMLTFWVGQAVQQPAGVPVGRPFEQLRA